MHGTGTGGRGLDVRFPGVVCFANLRKRGMPMAKSATGYRRILLKLSGEALGGEGGVGIDTATIDRVAGEIKAVVQDGRQVAIVMGAGNFIRGASGVKEGMDRVVADQMGMIATVINALALDQGILRTGQMSTVFSAFGVGGIVETYTVEYARGALDFGGIVLCAGGTGNPLFTTDTAGVLRALELDCDVMLKATMVDGVYDKDPLKHPKAVKFDKITYTEVLERKLGIMDLTAIALAEKNNLPIVVFNLSRKGILKRIAKGDLKHATLISK